MIFISSLTFSSHKRTAIKFVDFMAFLAFLIEDGASLVAHIVKSLPAMHDEVGMRWEKLKLGDANQIRLNHTIMSAYFLKFCEHNLNQFTFAVVDFYLHDSSSDLMSNFSSGLMSTFHLI